MEVFTNDMQELIEAFRFMSKKVYIFKKKKKCRNVQYINNNFLYVLLQGFNQVVSTIHVKGGPSDLRTKILQKY